MAQAENCDNYHFSCFAKWAFVNESLTLLSDVFLKLFYLMAKFILCIVVSLNGCSQLKRNFMNTEAKFHECRNLEKNFESIK